MSNPPPVKREIPTVKATDAHRLAARRLLREGRTAALATQWLKDGSPYASFVTYATDHAGRPLLLLSELSDHTQSLLVDPRCSLLIATGDGLPNPQTGPRFTVQAVAERISGDQEAALRRRFLARHPGAALYAGFGDFALWRLNPSGGHWIGGFGRAVWLGADFLLPQTVADGFAAAEVTALVNYDSGPAITGLGLSGDGWRAVALDADGVDMGRGEDDIVQRWPFDPPHS